MSSSPSGRVAAKAAKPLAPTGGFALHRLLPTFFRPGTMDLVLLSRQLAVFQRAGVPLVPAVEALAEQASSPTLRDALYAVRDDVVAGYPLSSAFARRRDVFPRIYIDMVRAGEATGRLEVVLGQIAVQLERAAAARRRVLSALMYPVLVMLLALVVVVVMTLFVLPAMSGLFREFQAELPLPTRIVLGSAQFARQSGAVTLLGLAIFAVLLLAFGRTGPGGRLFDRVSLALPISGGIRKAAIVERTTRTLATLLTSGVPLVEAVELVRDTTGSSTYTRHLEDVRVRMLRGEGFAEPLSKSNLYPPLVRQMARVGERTGTLDQLLRETADYYGEELEVKIATVLQLLEPALTILVALMVGFVALSVIMPIYSLIGSIQ